MRNLRHQLRTPVNHIVGFGEMLQEEATDRCWDTLLPDLEHIRQAGRGLSEYIGSTVDLAKVEAGVLDAELISRGLRTPLESIIGYSQLLQEEAEDHGWTEALPDLQKIESAAKYLTTLITAVLELTRIYAPEGPRIPPARPGHAVREAPAPPACRWGSLLLADDDDLDAEMMSRRLEQFGYQVRRVPSGQAALALLEQAQFDLLLLDVLMPEQDGLETLRGVKSMAAVNDLPVLMISAIEEIPIVVRCIELGADDYLVKPVDPVLLRAKIGAALERRRLRQRELDYLGCAGAFSAAVAALEHGAFEATALAEVAARKDPLGQLARVFQRMAGTIQAREAALQRQVRELSGGQSPLSPRRERVKVREATSGLGRTSP
ncbi:MAG: response regulator [Chloroflexota bacterium]